jgi:hypothetical protein
MAKKTYAERKEELTSLKEDAKQARKDFKNFCKEAKLDPEADSAADAKHGKKWTKLKALVDKTAKAVTETETWLTENKEKKERTERASKYTYPPEITTAADKKKYRAQQRAAANKKDKGEAAGTEKVSKKKKKKTEEKAPEAAAPAKKSKKDKKEKKAEVAED